MKILIIGGYGVFGGRLAHLLAPDTRLALVIAGRSLDKAQHFCATLPAGAAREARALDRASDIESALRAIAPDLVVEATGPYQVYGDSPYRVIEAAIACGINYLDLADCAEFVEGVRQFDAAATARSVYVLSGVSSFPVLTAAVVRRLAVGLLRVDRIRGGIAPSPYAGVGQNVIRAIASYAGTRIALTRDGAPATGVALVEAWHYTIAPPGHVPLRRLRFSLVDVPDLTLLPLAWPGLRSIWMGAAPVPAVWHRMLSALAWLRARHLCPDLTFLAPLFFWAINHLRWGEHRGGMFVEIEAVDADGKNYTRAWHLLAEGSDGPLIPSMACQAVIARVLAGAPPAPGARPATADLELADYEKLFSTKTIFTGVRESVAAPDTRPLYARTLDSAWEKLPATVRALHAHQGKWRAKGEASVERGAGFLAGIVARAVGFPKAGSAIPVEVRFESNADGEWWHRNFDGKLFKSYQAQGCDDNERLLTERFGPFTFGLALVLKNEALHLVVRSWNFLGVPLPNALVPTGNTYEYEHDGRFHFHVEIAHPWLGLIVRYRGWLVEDAM